jgi:hypothetical protein
MTSVSNMHCRLKPRECTENPRGSTHTRELDTAVTALGSGTLLLDVQVTEVTTGGLDDADTVGPRVVPMSQRNA